MKEEESLKNQTNNVERKLMEMKKEKASYESERKNITNKSEGLKDEIEKAKQLLKEKDIYEK